MASWIRVAHNFVSCRNLAPDLAWNHGRMGTFTHGVMGAWGHMGELERGVVIGVGNHKGGISKSSSTTYLASALGERGLRVLIIDCDPSGGATHIFGVDGKSFAGTFELVVDDRPDPVALAVSEGL